MGVLYYAEYLHLFERARSAYIRQWNEDKTRLLAEGMTQHALVNPQGRPVPVPDWFRRLCAPEKG